MVHNFDGIQVFFQEPEIGRFQKFVDNLVPKLSFSRIDPVILS